MQQCNSDKTGIIVLSITLCFFLTVLVLALSFAAVWGRENRQVYTPIPPIMPILPVPQQGSNTISIELGQEGHHKP